MAQLFIDITFPRGLPTVERTFQLRGNISWMAPGAWRQVGRRMTIQFGPGGPTVAGTFSDDRNWQCTGTISPSVPFGSMVQLKVRAQAVFRFFRTPFEPDLESLEVETTFVVRLTPPIPPTVTLDTFASPMVVPQVPAAFVFMGSASSSQAKIQRVEYKVEGGEFAPAVDLGGNWARFSVTLPLPPTAGGPDHVLTVRAIDAFGTSNEFSRPFAVHPDPPLVVPPGSDTTFSGAATTSSVTSWTRLEPQCVDADIGTSSSARVFDPLWLLARQWQMGEFQAEDAGTPIQARVRATTGMVCRRHPGELPEQTSPAPVAVSALPYDPRTTPLEVLVERRPMRARDADERRMLTFAVESGLHFLRMVDQQTLTKDYRAALTVKLALQPPADPGPTGTDDPSSRFVQSMVGRAPDGRRLAVLLRTTGAAQFVLDPALDIAPADRPDIQLAAVAWLEWYDAMYSEPTDASDDAWNAPRLEYAVSVGARLSAVPGDEVTFSADEIDGPIDWRAFDVDPRASLTTPADVGHASIVEATIPAPVCVRGLPAPRFWEMEDARVAFGLVPVGPTDLAHLLMIEYASTYGNDWYVVPLTLSVGSVTRVDSLVVTDTFGVRYLVRPINDPALPPAHFALWQSAVRNAPASGGARVVSNQFFLPPTLGRTIDGTPLEDVLFMRDEMANLAWAIERSVESPIEQAAPRYEVADAHTPGETPAVPNAQLPRYLLASEVPPNWIPLLPVQVPNPRVPNTPGQILSRLQRGAVLKPDGSRIVHRAAGDVLRSLGDALLYDEEVPREGARVTRQRRMARWTDGSTWVWTSYRNQVGLGEGSSQLAFDRVLEPGEGEMPSP